VFIRFQGTSDGAEQDPQVPPPPPAMKGKRPSAGYRTYASTLKKDVIRERGKRLTRECTSLVDALNSKFEIRKILVSRGRRE